MPFDEEELDPHGECRHEIERLRDEIKQLKDNSANQAQLIVKLMTKIRELTSLDYEAEIERLRAALQWYASVQNYRTDQAGDTEIDADKGAKARAALNFAKEKAPSDV